MPEFSKVRSCFSSAFQTVSGEGGAIVLSLFDGLAAC